MADTRQMCIRDRPNRLRIFAQLMRGDTCNCELVEQLAMPANLLSHHLRVLSEAGLVDARRDRHRPWAD